MYGTRGNGNTASLTIGELGDSVVVDIKSSRGFVDGVNISKVVNDVLLGIDDFNSKLYQGDGT